MLLLANYWASYPSLRVQWVSKLPTHHIAGYVMSLSSQSYLSGALEQFLILLEMLQMAHKMWTDPTNDSYMGLTGFSVPAKPINQCPTCKQVKTNQPIAHLWAGKTNKPMSHLWAGKNQSTNVPPVSRWKPINQWWLTCEQVKPINQWLTCEQVDWSNKSKSQHRAHWCIVLVWVIKPRVLVRVRRCPVAAAHIAQEKHGCDNVEHETGLTTSLYLIPLIRHKVRPPDWHSSWWLWHLHSCH